MGLFLLLAGVGRVMDRVVEVTDRIPRPITNARRKAMNLRHEAGDWLLRKMAGQ